jgi:hypothetical protein
MLKTIKRRFHCFQEPTLLYSKLGDMREMHERTEGESERRDAALRIHGGLWMSKEEPATVLCWLEAVWVLYAAVEIGGAALLGLKKRWCVGGGESELRLNW